VTDELVEHVDVDGSVLAVVTRAEMRRRRLRHRCVFIAVITTDDQLVVHRRADWKDLWPSFWDIAFGGVVTAGEDWDRAAARELAEEAGIEAVPLRFLGEASFEDGSAALLGRAYAAVSDGPFTHPDGEVAESALVPLVELDAWLAGRDVCPDSVAIVRPLLRGTLA
jgi:8-oxo-dGTP pyrophosphatase MutT (NUDIX family)